MKHADHWLYSACRVGQTGTSGYQTYTRTPGVEPDEEAELARVVAFVAKTSDRAGFSAFGWYPLASGRYAIWKSSQGAVDDLGRDTFFSEAFIVSSWEDLAAPPYTFFGCKRFREPLSREEVSAPDVPPLLAEDEGPELPMHPEIKRQGDDITDEILKSSLKQFPRRALVLANHVLCGTSDTLPSVLIKGSPEEVLAAFAFLWEASLHVPTLRRQLSLCTLLSESNNAPFTVAGRPANWGEPSPQLRARFSTRFGWEAAPEASPSPIHLRREEVEKAVRECYAELFSSEGEMLLREAGLQSNDPVLSRYRFLQAPAAKAKDPAALEGFRDLLLRGHLEIAYAQHPEHIRVAAAALTPLQLDSADAKLEPAYLEQIKKVLGTKTPPNIHAAIETQKWLARLDQMDLWENEVVDHWLAYCRNLPSKAWEGQRRWYASRLTKGAVGHHCLLMADNHLGIAWEKGNALGVTCLARACALNAPLAEPVAYLVHRVLTPGQRTVLLRVIRDDPAAWDHVSNALANDFGDPTTVTRWLTESRDELRCVLDALSPEDHRAENCLRTIAQHPKVTELVRFWQDSTTSTGWTRSLAHALAERMTTDAALGRELGNKMGLKNLVKQSGISDIKRLLTWQVDPYHRIDIVEAFFDVLKERSATLPAKDAPLVLAKFRSVPIFVLSALDKVPMAELLEHGAELYQSRQGIAESHFQSYPRFAAALATAVARNPQLEQNANIRAKWQQLLERAWPYLFNNDRDLLSDVPQKFKEMVSGHAGATAPKSQIKAFLRGELLKPTGLAEPISGSKNAGLMDVHPVSAATGDALKQEESGDQKPLDEFSDIQVPEISSGAASTAAPSIGAISDVLEQELTHQQESLEVAGVACADNNPGLGGHLHEVVQPAAFKEPQEEAARPMPLREEPPRTGSQKAPPPTVPINPHRATNVTAQPARSTPQPVSKRSTSIPLQHRSAQMVKQQVEPPSIQEEDSDDRHLLGEDNTRAESPHVGEKFDNDSHDEEETHVSTDNSNKVTTVIPGKNRPRGSLGLLKWVARLLLGVMSVIICAWFWLHRQGLSPLDWIRNQTNDHQTDRPSGSNPIANSEDLPPEVAIKIRAIPQLDANGLDDLKRNLDQFKIPDPFYEEVLRMITERKKNLAAAKVKKADEPESKTNEGTVTSDTSKIPEMITPTVAEKQTDGSSRPSTSKPVVVVDKMSLIKKLSDADSPATARTTLQNTLNQMGRNDAKRDEIAALIPLFDAWIPARPGIKKKLEDFAAAVDAGNVEDAKKGVDAINSDRKIFPELMGTLVVPRGGLVTNEELERLVNLAQANKAKNAQMAGQKMAEFRTVLDQAKSAKADGRLLELSAQIEALKKLKGELAQIGHPLQPVEEREILALDKFEKDLKDVLDSLQSGELDPSLEAKIGELGFKKDKPASACLHWALQIRKKLATFDYVGALVVYHTSKENKDGQIGMENMPDGSWQKLQQSIRKTLMTSVGNELIDRETLLPSGSNGQDSKSWYAAPGTKAAKAPETVNIVKEFQIAIMKWDKSVNMQLKGKPLRDFFVNLDGRWGEDTLNAVIAAQHQLGIDVTGTISDQLIEKLGINYEEDEEQPSNMSRAVSTSEGDDSHRRDNNKDSRRRDNKK